ncbi:ADP-ribosylglycohydrolase family protein [Scytonema sp. NUACC21]
MQYSLLSRFDGVLLGAILGERVAARKGCLVDGVETSSGRLLHWSEIAILCAENLISLGRLNPGEWHKQEQEIQLDNETSVILATLPVALFFHDNLIKLRQNVMLLTNFLQCDAIITDGTLALSYAVAQSLTEKLHQATLIPQTISFLGETSTSFPQQLLKVQNLLKSGAPLDIAQGELSREEKPGNAIAMAFYCFLSTLEDFRLSVLRADRMGRCSKTVSSITGALSGAYNGTAGIPAIWQISLNCSDSTQKWELGSCSDILRLTDRLMAVWSGVYEIACDPNEDREDKSAFGWRLLSSSQAVAAPRVIRLR